MSNQIFIELAARCPVEILNNEEKCDTISGDDGITKVVYRFDTRMVGGDYHIVKIPMPFAEPTHMAARTQLYNDLRTWFKK